MVLVRSLLAIGMLVSTAAAADEAALIKQNLQGLVIAPNQVTSVMKTPYGDLYEVVINGRDIGYSDASGSIFISGSIIDLKTRTNVSERRLAELRKIDFSALPTANAIVKVKGNGARKIAVFSDPDCPYCKQLEPELAKLDNVTIYTFLLPLVGIHPDAMRKATLIWCAKDRGQAWDAWMLEGRLPEGSSLSCSTPILENVELAQRLGIQGTPGITLQNGVLIPGMLPFEQLDLRISAAERG